MIIEKLKKHEKQQKADKLNAGTLWNNTGYVFTTSIGTTIEPRNILRAFHKLLEKASLNKRGLHTLRHYVATRAIENGIDVKTLSELLGHEDVSTTLNLYVHSSEAQRGMK